MTHFEVLLRATYRFIAIAVVLIVFYPIVFGSGWSADDSATVWARVLVPALMIGGLTLVRDAFFNDKSPLLR